MTNCILKQITNTTPTEFWNDTCEVKSLKRSVAWGGTGATSNPVIVLQCIEKDPQRWVDEIANIRKKDKSLSEIDIAWKLIRRLAIEAMPVLRPIYDKTAGRNGRLSVQVNPKYFTNSDKMIEHALEFSTWGENLAIKIPGVEAGYTAMEELVAKGVSTNATVQYSVSQAIATAEAFERGYKRAQKQGIDISRMSTWSSIMVGRLDDHLRDEQKNGNIPVNTDDIHYASLAVFKKIYKIYQERGYRTKLLAAAIRGSYHMMDYVGGEIVVTLPPSWQVFINGTGEPIVSDAIKQPTPAEKIEKLRTHFPDFSRAYDEDGMKIEDFIGFGSTRKTLRQFIGGYEDLLHFVRDCML